MDFEQKYRFKEIYEALQSGALQKADVETLKQYLKATYNLSGDIPPITSIHSARQMLQSLIDAKESSAAHSELRRDNRCLIRLAVLTLIVAALTLLSTLFLPGGCATLKPAAPATNTVK